VQVLENFWEIQRRATKKCVSRIKILVRCLQKLYATLIMPNVAS